MKIALIGDFSGVHYSLKVGFDALGHETDVYADGDGFKNIPSNKVLNPICSGNFDKIRHRLFGLPNLLKNIASNYDAIQLINPYVIPSFKILPTTYYHYLMSILKESQGYKSLAVLGCEKNTQRTLSSLSRSPCPGCLIDYSSSKCPFISANNSKITDYAVDFADTIIPYGIPIYSAPYLHVKKTATLLPFPVASNHIKFLGNKLNRKIRILHGINRPGFKGSKIIMEALVKIESSFPNSFEIIKVERLQFKNYLQLLPTVNVVIDQLYGGGLAMNALFSMLSGCVVFTHFDRVKDGELNLLDAPAIQIGITVDEIFNQLAELRTWSADDFDQVGEKSHQFVKNNCFPVNIASQVIEIWQNSSKHNK